MVPYRGVLHHYPWKLDAIRWVVRGAQGDGAWMRWVFESSHFVGYRPVAALSYTLNHMLAGWTPEAYRATDFFLFGLTAVAVAALFRALVDRTDAWMVLAAVLFVAHPASEEIVPFLARRSYTLSVLFSTVGLTAWILAARREGAIGIRGAVAAIALLLAILSNEVAYVVLPLYPLFALHLTGSIRQAVVRTLPTLGLASVAIALRFAIIDSTGGYVKRYLAVTRDGAKHLSEPDGFTGHRVFASALEYACLPVGMSGTANPFRADWSQTTLFGLPPLDFTQVVRVLLFLVLSFYLWTVTARPLVERDRRGVTGLLLVIWLIGYALLFGAVRTWFWRQGFPMTVPVALLVTWTLRETVVLGAPRWRLAPQLLLVASLLWHSPVIHGMSDYKMQARSQANDLLQDLRPLLAGVERGATVYLIVPGNRGTVRTFRRWLTRDFADLGVRWHVLAHGLPRTKLARRTDAGLHLERAARIPDSTRRRLSIDEHRRVSFEWMTNHDLDPWVIWPDETGAWHVEKLK